MNIHHIIIIKGAGDLATGVAHKLFRSGFPIIMTEVEKPTCVRRNVSFANCIYEGEWEVEGVKAKNANHYEEVLEIMSQNSIPVFIDKECSIKDYVKPLALVDAILAKKNTGTTREDAPLVIGLGPGFKAGDDVDIVIETNRGHDLGRLIFEGYAEADTGVPGEVGGYTVERVIRAPAAGIIQSCREIGEAVKKGEVIALIGEVKVRATIDGIIKGLIYNQSEVEKGMKIGDIDPRINLKTVNTISEKGRCIAGGVLEAIMIHSKDKIL
jgi:xanthine dehydrogenase accessory factor